MTTTTTPLPSSPPPIPSSSTTAPQTQTETKTTSRNDKKRNNSATEKQFSINSVLCLFGFAALLRILVGFHPHSGQNNYHGAKKAYGGDFEAQRHWMEIAYHLPIGDWYWYDLEYWGLDYPPLTAYISYICGAVSHFVVGPESVALDTSRGIEDPTHKAYMRFTVLFFDLLVFASAIWFSVFQNDRKSWWMVLVAFCQPAIVLIDHGHFQYNTIALGLSIFAFRYMVRPSFGSCIIGSILFSLALNFKQMTLYYAPAVFFYLLGRCFSKLNLFPSRFIMLGLAVILTFFVLWQPLLSHGPSHTPTTVYDRGIHILKRIFPFERGLFEGKVANIWCALSTKPVNIRDRIDPDLQPMLALTLTLAMILPSSLLLFRVGSRTQSTKSHWIALLWGATSSALSFFLASFQVHEKSILLALAPCTLLLWEDPSFVDWFSLVCVWSLWPLLQVDRLDVAYFCTVAIFGSLIWFRRLGRSRKKKEKTVFSGLIMQHVPTLCYLGMLGLHGAQAIVKPPPNLPDLYEVLWSVAGCGMFCVAWLISCWKLYRLNSPMVVTNRQSGNKKSKTE